MTPYLAKRSPWLGLKLGWNSTVASFSRRKPSTIPAIPVIGDSWLCGQITLFLQQQVCVAQMFLTWLDRLLFSHYLNLCLTRHPITFHPPFCTNDPRILQMCAWNVLASVRKYQNNKPYARLFYFLFVNRLTLPTCFPPTAATSAHKTPSASPARVILKVVSNEELYWNVPQ